MVAKIKRLRSRGGSCDLGEIYAPAIQRILNRLSIGAEWRYNLLGNGEGFNQYTSSVHTPAKSYRPKGTRSPRRRKP